MLLVVVLVVDLASLRINAICTGIRVDYTLQTHDTPASDKLELLHRPAVCRNACRMIHAYSIHTPCLVHAWATHPFLRTKFDGHVGNMWARPIQCISSCTSAIRLKVCTYTYICDSCTSAFMRLRSTYLPIRLGGTGARKLLLSSSRSHCRLCRWNRI